VNDRSAAIREYHQNRGKKIETPDAIHLATAVLYKADEFQTMDGLDKRGKPKRILGLSGDIGGYPLFITQPYPRSGVPTQSHLFLSNSLPVVSQPVRLEDVSDGAKEKGKTGTIEDSTRTQADATGSAGNATGAPEASEEKKG
jgi:hypothetical protein